MAPGRIVRVRHRAGARAVLRPPLVRTGGALGQFPFIAEQVGEIIVAPFRRRRGPDDLQAAGDRVVALARAEPALPAQPLFLKAGVRCALGTDDPGVIPCTLPGEWQAARDLGLGEPELLALQDNAVADGWCMALPSD